MGSTSTSTWSSRTNELAGDDRARRRRAQHRRGARARARHRDGTFSGRALLVALLARTSAVAGRFRALLRRRPARDLRASERRRAVGGAAATRLVQLAPGTGGRG